MIIELNEYDLEIFFQHAQLEVTGICNMKCDHCRACDELAVNLPIPIIKKSVDFLVSEKENEDLRLTVSGGEPFTRKDLPAVIGVINDSGVNNIIITTNGSLVNQKVIDELCLVGVKNLSIQVSLDSYEANFHDAFRHYPGAFNKAIHALRLVVGTGIIVPSLRTTVTPSTIDQIDRLVDLGLNLGVKRIGIGSVIPAGSGKVNRELLITPDQKKKLMMKISDFKRQYPEVDITTEDPLKFATGDEIWDFGDFDPNDESFFGGCTAGVAGFNVDSEGVVTPCAVFLEKILKIEEQSVGELVEEYRNSPVIKQLALRDLGGKCGTCRLKRLCGGCRAVAAGYSGNYLGEDATCWL